MIAQELEISLHMAFGKNLTQHIAEQTPRIAADREVDTQPTLRCEAVVPK
jgi:hypothetical protein